MSDLVNIYSQLTKPWTEAELRARYRDAERRRAQPLDETDTAATSALSLVASAIPPTATASVAIHVLHVLPETAPDELADQLVGTASRNVTTALRRGDRALERDGADHDYRADEWLPLITEIAGRTLQSACLNEDPPTVVAQAQNAIASLSHAVVELHDDSTEAPTALSEGLACLLVVSVFADLAVEPARFA
jgi:hypothetical protein